MRKRVKANWNQKFAEEGRTLKFQKLHDAIIKLVMFFVLMLLWFLMRQNKYYANYILNMNFPR
jgi:hypothetical protein